MRHGPNDLRQLQSLPLEAKIMLTKQRIEVWYESWMKFTIYDKATGKRRWITADTRAFGYEPPMKETEYVELAEPGQVYVSFSGGKDSTVLKHIVDGMYDDVPALFVNTGLEYPEIQRFAMKQPNTITVRPEMRFDEVLKKYGYPVVTKRVSETVYYAKKNIAEGKETTRVRLLNGEEKKTDGKTSFFNCRKWSFLADAPFDVSSQCCAVMKKKPLKAYAKQTGRMPITAQMAHESVQRRAQWIQHGCNAFDKKSPISNPMSFWTEQDILHYLKKYNVPYCSVYGDIVTKDPDGNVYDAPAEYIDLFENMGGEAKLMTTGCDRTGCVFCLYGCHLEGEPNRFQRLKETHPRQYEYCIGGGEMVDGKWQPNKQGLGLGKVMDYIGVKYE